MSVRVEKGIYPQHPAVDSDHEVAKRISKGTGRSSKSEITFLSHWPSWVTKV